MTGCHRKLLCDGVTCAVSFKRKRNTGVNLVSALITNFNKINAVL